MFPIIQKTISARCAPTSEILVIHGERTDLPPPPTKCGHQSIVIDPTYEIIHWTPELRREFTGAITP